MTFSDSMDKRGPSRDFTVCSIRCVSRRIDTWQIVYLSSKEACPTISIHKSEIYLNVPWTAMELAKIRKFQHPKSGSP